MATAKSTAPKSTNKRSNATHARAKLTDHEVALMAEFFENRAVEGMTSKQAADAFVGMLNRRR
ncbi:MAG: hypothetical protein GEV05_00785 [Betaproteobacteria bacterium]|nr:hypothetical protein [Betaproteobacteria bacterium]